jgi:prephenate dehydrogenase
MLKIAIFGVGLIGGSLALCFKGKPGIKVVGHSNNPASVEKYLKRNVVDEATTSMLDAVKDADFIFLCGPVGVLEHYLHTIHQLPLKPGCIITDVGSTKQSVCEFAASLQMNDVYFIGGHPMAGSERSGVEAASSHLFENAFYVLTPDDEVPEPVYNRLEKLLRLTKAQIIRMDADEHDGIVGAVSHLPHVIAVALVNQVCRYNDSNDLYERLAAGGFRDITRIASGEPVMWRDILLNNRQVLLKLLEDWNAQISGFMDLLKQEDGEGIVREFRNAGAFRAQLPERRKGMISSMYDIYVDVPDHPGIIGRIATHLGNHKINLSNLQIIESRMDVPGVLRLSFRNEQDMDRAIAALKEIDLEVHL